MPLSPAPDSTIRRRNVLGEQGDQPLDDGGVSVLQQPVHRETYSWRSCRRAPEKTAGSQAESKTSRSGGTGGRGSGSASVCVPLTDGHLTGTFDAHDQCRRHRSREAAVRRAPPGAIAARTEPAPDRELAAVPSGRRAGTAESPPRGRAARSSCSSKPPGGGEHQPQEPLLLSGACPRRRARAACGGQASSAEDESRRCSSKSRLVW